MAKKSNIVPIPQSSTRPKEPEMRAAERKEFYCDRCGKKYTRQKSNFPSSQSTLYRGNNGYLSTCNHCIDDLFDHYKSTLGSEKLAMERICMKYDIYWSLEIFGMLNRSYTNGSRVRSYISKTNLNKHLGKTYDDTLDEEGNVEVVSTIEETAEVVERRSIQQDKEINVSPEIVRYWGTGFTPEMYVELENRRDYWISQYPEDTILDPGEEALLRQICNLEISINNDRVAGKPIEKSVNALNTLLGSMNIKPSQKKEAEETFVPFGVEIKQFEDDDPIPDPDPMFDDVDGMHKNVISWFLGSLCKTAGINNKYSEFFDEEIAKYSVEKPEFEDDVLSVSQDDDDMNPFGGDNPDGNV